jgi:hypothetical protein
MLESSRLISDLTRADDMFDSPTEMLCVTAASLGALPEGNKSAISYTLRKVWRTAEMGRAAAINPDCHVQPTS